MNNELLKIAMYRTVQRNIWQFIIFCLNNICYIKMEFSKENMNTYISGVDEETIYFIHTTDI